MSEKNRPFPSALQALLLIVALFAVEIAVGAVINSVQGLLGLTPSQAWALGSLIANGCVFATAVACSRPIVPGSTPSTPLAPQEGASSAGGGSRNRQR